MKDEKKRTLYLKVRVSPEEMAAIKKFENSGMSSLSTFVRAMIFEGYIAVDQPKRNGIDTIETDTFTCIVFDDNAKSVNFLYSKGGQITFVGSLRKAPNNTVVIIVEELHFQNRFAVKVDVDSDQLF